VDARRAAKLNEKKTALVVEDSLSQVMHLQHLLEQERLNVVLAVDGEMGLAMARNLHPDVVVLDLKMPRMNGIQVAQALKQSPETAGIPVVLFTSYSEVDAKELCEELGAVEFIPKDAFADAVLVGTLKHIGIIAT
jgi:CheY-like chemotaxis protein